MIFTLRYFPRITVGLFREDEVPVDWAIFEALFDLFEQDKNFFIDLPFKWEDFTAEHQIGFLFIKMNYSLAHHEQS